MSQHGEAVGGATDNNDREQPRRPAPLQRSTVDRGNEPRRYTFSRRESIVPDVDAFTQTCVVYPKRVESSLDNGVIRMISEHMFGGSTVEDVREHLRTFASICMVYCRASDVHRLMVFPFSLQDEAKRWFDSLPPKSLDTWEKMATAFITKYCPLSKTLRMRNAISNLCQLEYEEAHDAWRRFKELVDRCPQIDMSNFTLLGHIDEGLQPENKRMLDATAGGSFMAVTNDEALDILDMMTENESWSADQEAPREARGTHDMSRIDALNAKVEALTLLAKSFKEGPKKVDNAIESMMERVDYANNFRACLDFNASTMLEGSGGSNWNQTIQDQRYQQHQAPPDLHKENKPSLEDSFQQFMRRTESALLQFMQSTDQRFTKIENCHLQQATDFKNLEGRMDGMTTLLSARTQGKLPSNTEKDPREQVNTINHKAQESYEEESDDEDYWEVNDPADEDIEDNYYLKENERRIRADPEDKAWKEILLVLGSKEHYEYAKARRAREEEEQR